MPISSENQTNYSGGHPIAASAPLAVATRLSDKGLPLVENRYRGWVVASDAAGHLTYCTPGGEVAATFFRSAAKPFQALPLVRTGLAAQLPPEELAIACASHVASDYHLKLVERLLQRAGVSENALQCGPHAPLDAAMNARLTREAQPPTALCNNCSGKHAGMLLACRHSGWPLENYLDPAHPLQRAIVEILTHYAGVAEIPQGIDGCGAPVFYLPLAAMARLYAQLASAPEFAPITQAMTEAPLAVGGEGRIDTELMRASGGRLLAKVGADGLICVSHLENRQGLALKIEDGSTEARNAIIVPILRQLGWLSEAETRDARLQQAATSERRNTLNAIVGHFAYIAPENAHV